MSKIPKSLLKRSTKLLTVAGKMALSEVNLKLKTWETEKEKIKARMEQAQELVKTLSELKGASMKLGQLLSLDFGDYLPPEVLKILEQLHQKSTFLPYTDIEKILVRELKDHFSDLSEISPLPIAAASIGQVHRAKLQEKEVIIKVQYPGVAQAIPSDLRILELILKQINFLTLKKEIDLKPLLDEVHEVLIKETDYQNETKMHLLYKAKFKDSSYVIPKAYPNYSTNHVLIQEFIPGVSFSQWLSQSPSSEKKEQVADLLMKLYLEEVFIHQVVQTDPNPGNFLITPDQKLALIDFGAVKEYSSEFVQGYRKILKAALRKDQESVLKTSYHMGIIDPRESEEVKELSLKMMDFLVSPFRNEGAFDFNDQDFLYQSRDLSWELARKSRFTPPPRDLIFLHRKLGGIFVFLKKLETKIKLKDYWHYVEDS